MESSPMPSTLKNESMVVSALRVRTKFGKVLRRVEEQQQSLIIEKRGRPRAVLLSLRDYVRLAAPEPEVLRIIGEEAQANGTAALSSKEIDRIIKEARRKRKKR